MPFTISCGECFFCKSGYSSGCERSNPHREKAPKLWGNLPAGLFGYSRLLGGYSGELANKMEKSVRRMSPTDPHEREETPDNTMTPGSGALWPPSLRDDTETGTG